MALTPDTKNWTWVIERACPYCGFDGPRFDTTTTAARVRGFGGEWALILSREDVRRRPAPHVWSPLEYGCHVRDVFLVYDGRLERILTEDDPTYANWDQDATAVDEQYPTQVPATVAEGVRVAANRLADRFDAVVGDQWQRTGNRSDGARFTVDSFARYLVHDIVHHVWDVTPRP